MASNLETLVTVFGGSGFVGRSVVRALCKRDYRVRVAVRRPELAGHLQPLGRVGQIHAVQANLRYPASVEAAMRYYARLWGEDEELWAATGILHDLDYEKHPDLETGHPRVALALFEERGYPPELIAAAREMFAAARAGGVRVTEEELRASLRGRSLTTGDLTRIPREYKSALDDMIANGIDPNEDPLEGDFVALEEAIDKGLLGVTREEWERECASSS